MLNTPVPPPLAASISITSATTSATAMRPPQLAPPPPNKNSPKGPATTTLTITTPIFSNVDSALTYPLAIAHPPHASVWSVTCGSISQTGD
ncbi:hypothetical protein SprV_0200783300 [Sparganum proliferum]